jgi:DNA polymerase-3 subunit alpha
MSYAHLHNHTHYSLLDGAATPEGLVKSALQQGHTAVGLTDHGVMFGAVEFYKKAKKAGIKAVLGCEVYMASGSRFDKSSGKRAADGSKSKNYYHLILLAKDQTGYRNLIKLCSIGHTEGFYYKPRIDREVLEQYHEGLVCTSACIGGVVGDHLIRRDYETARSVAEWYKGLFGDDFYIEIQQHFLEPDKHLLELAPQLARELGIKLVATNDCHYINPMDAVAHNVHLFIKEATQANAGTLDVERLRYGTPEYYFKSTEQMVALLGSYDGAIENTIEIADKCNFKLDSSLHMPAFPIPSSSQATTLDEYMEELTKQGIERHYNVAHYADAPPEVRQRTEFELGVIRKMGYAGYFLIVQDFINAARQMGVSVGPGRGSAAGSLVAYALGITNVDPLKYDLLFERFLNPERVSMPDIDVDFNDEKREMVIDYVRQKYGETSVAQIVTFGTLSTKAVIKDVARVLGVPLATVDQITKPIPVVLGKVTPLKEALELAELRWVKESDDPKIKKLIEYALVLEGFARNTSIHAAGVVIAPGDISQFVPLFKQDSTLATQYNMKDLEDAGLLKMDFLGLRTLSIIDNAVAMIERNHGVKIDVDTLDLFDKKTYDMLSAGKTIAIFQFESEPMQKYLKMLKPTNLEDLTAMNALYRPGPMDNIPEFCARKQGTSPISYLHPLMESSLKTTYGIIVYQEQVMQLVRDLAGFSLAQADIMRRAMGKKDAKAMAEQKEAFIEGAVKVNKMEKKLAGEIFELIQKFASYGFNKSHALAYSYLAFQTAWLKAHYPAEFLAANMSAELGNQDKIVTLIDEAKYFGIEVLPPDVNESLSSFTAIPSTHALNDQATRIRFGMAALKNVGEGAVQNIVRAREQKRFASFFDFAARVDTKSVNKRALEALVCAGAFDTISSVDERSRLFAAIDDALKYSHAQAESKEMAMDSLFGGASEAGVMEPKLPSADKVPLWSYFERLKREKEFLNFYVSGHPLERYRPHTAFANLQLGNKDSKLIDNPQNLARVCGVVTSIRTKLDKKEQMIAFVGIEDFTGKAECVFWSDAYARYREVLKEDAVIMVIGKAQTRGSDAISIVVDELLSIEDTPPRFAKGLRISVQRTITQPADIERAHAALAKLPRGKAEIFFSVFDERQRLVQRYHAHGLKIQPSDAAAEELITIFGQKNVQFLMEV